MQGGYKRIRWLLILALVSFNVMTLVYFSVNLVDIVKFTASILFFTVIPGLLFLDYLNIYRSTAYRFVLAAGTGICLDIILYIAFSIMQIKILLYVVFALIFIIYLMRKNLYRDVRLLVRSIEGLENRYFLYLSLLAASVPVIVSTFYFLPNLLPGGSQAVIYYVDFPWHMGNIAEIKNHWYPEDPRLAGNPFHYHIFLYVYLAFISFLGHVSIPVIFLRLYMLFLINLLFLASYFSGSRWFSKRATGVLNVVIFLGLGTCLLSSPYNLFLKDFFLSPTFLLAVILTLFLISEIKEYIAAGKGNLWLILLVVLGVSGSKGSFFPVIFAGLLACLLYGLICGQKNRRIYILTGSSFVVFLPVFIYIFRGVGSEGINIVPLEIIHNTSLFLNYQAWFNNNGSIFLIFSFIPLYFLLFFSFRSLAFLNLVKDLFTSIKNIPLDKLFAAGMIIASFIPGYFFSYRGSSQYFYLFAGYIMLNILASGYLYCSFTQKNKFIKIVLILLLLGATVDTVLTAKDYNHVNAKLADLNNKPLTPGLYEGLVYLRDNSDKDALIGSYRSFWMTEENSRFFYYSAFSERRILVEGWEYMGLVRRDEAMQRHEDMKKLYSTRDADIARNILNKYDINYLIVDQFSRQKLRFPTGRLLKLRFENDAVKIYETLNPSRTSMQI